MVDTQTIEIVKQKLLETCDPEEIYIIGSFAWGKSDEESDLDLRIVVEFYTDTWHNLIVSGHRVLARLGLAKDILFFSREEFEEQVSHVSTLCYKVKHEGIKIFARA